MHSTINRVIFFLSVMVLTYSCRKGEYQEKHYFGNISVGVKSLPGVSTIMLYFENEKLDSVRPDTRSAKFALPSGKPGKLSVYDAHTNQFLTDTTITIFQDSLQELNFAYGPELGIAKFVDKDGIRVHKDSIYMQIFNDLDPAYYPKKKYGFRVIQVDPETGEIVTPIEINDFEWKKLNSTMLKLRVLDNNGNEITTVTQLVDLETGEVITQPDGFEYITGFPSGPMYAGKYFIGTIYFDLPNFTVQLRVAEL